jgi:hypothetical protein
VVTYAEDTIEDGTIVGRERVSEGEKGAPTIGLRL